MAQDGSVRYSYLQVQGPQTTEGVYRGIVHLLDANFNTLKGLVLLPTADHPSLPADLHEFVYINDNDYPLESYQPKVVSNIPGMPDANSSVLASVIQEVRDGRVVFDWDSANYPEFYANSSDDNAIPMSHRRMPTTCT